MGGGRDDPDHGVLVLGRHAGPSPAAPMLGPVGNEGGALDIAAVGDGDHHGLAGNEVLVLKVAAAVNDLGAAGNGEVGLHLHQLVADDAHEQLAGLQDRQKT